LKPLVRIIPGTKGDPSQLGKVHIARESDLLPCCGLHVPGAGEWQVDIAVQPDCARCLAIHAKFVGTFTPPLRGLFE
jgi:hypothetical protein